MLVEQGIESTDAFDALSIRVSVTWSELLIRADAQQDEHACVDGVTDPDGGVGEAPADELVHVLEFVELDVRFAQRGEREQSDECKRAQKDDVRGGMRKSIYDLHGILLQMSLSSS